MSRYQSEQSWILHRRAWRESSLLLELFSREHGRVGLVARGLRSQRSPWRGLGEPFTPLRTAWVRRGELGTLTDIEALAPRGMLGNRGLWCGLYANELLLTLVERDEPVPELFDAYAALLPELVDASSQATALRRFELALLGCLGVAPDLHNEALQGDPIRPDGDYRLEPEAGFVVAAPGHGVYSGRAILWLAGKAPIDADGRRQAREIMRTLIDQQLNGRRLKTRELFRDWQ